VIPLGQSEGAWPSAVEFLPRSNLGVVARIWARSQYKLQLSLPTRHILAIDRDAPLTLLRQKFLRLKLGY
jgi:hypothetical protein